MIQNQQTRPLSGDQYILNFTDNRGYDHILKISSLGSAIREYSVDQKNVVVPFSEDSLPFAYSGTILIPWPNRLEDGEYSFEGVDYQAPINEVKFNNQIHGFSQFHHFELIDKTETSVTLGLRLPPQKSYPFEIYTEIKYILSDDGLTIDSEIKNLSSQKVPIALGWHPWFDTRGDMDDAKLSLTANKYVTVNDRLLPTGEARVDETDFDIRDLKTLKDKSYDDAWIDLVLDNGYSRAELVGADGHKVTVKADENYKAWQICSANGFGDSDYRFGIALEPMTATANAFKDKKLLNVLAPNGENGDTLATSWGIFFE